MKITLSTQRAQTVAGFLTAHGVPGNQIAVKGFGSVNPVPPMTPWKVAPRIVESNSL